MQTELLQLLKLDDDETVLREKDRILKKLNEASKAQQSHNYKHIKPVTVKLPLSGNTIKVHALQFILLISFL